MLGEVHAEAEVRRPVQAGQEAVDDRLREQLQVPDPAEDGRVEELGASCGRPGTKGRQALRPYMPEEGTGARSSSMLMSSVDVLPSDSAWKFVRTRWRSTGWASELMSSNVTW